MDCKTCKNYDPIIPDGIKTDELREGMLLRAFFELYKEAQETICEDCGHKGCEFIIHGPWGLFLCEKCGLENKCVDLESPNEAEIYY